MNISCTCELKQRLSLTVRRYKDSYHHPQNHQSDYYNYCALTKNELCSKRVNSKFSKFEFTRFEQNHRANHLDREVKRDPNITAAAGVWRGEEAEFEFSTVGDQGVGVVDRLICPYGTMSGTK
ncbi:GRB2-related adapter protein 2 [Striga asiatica]|uniref:GRB2-related adapter protein 2 n=1 Tax=Striga asiatica TaxID=4170 RepID=A0A5A7QIY0_STRAF|nr:GRB2-related adapter protein 2 [Striga asiatica]